MKPVSLKNYALILGLITILIFLFFAFFTRTQIKSAQENLNQWKMQTTREELTSAIAAFKLDGQKAAKEFSEWDEVRQQLSSPAFYEYWRNQRMVNSDFLSPGVHAAHIYTVDGKPLMGVDTGELSKQLNNAVINQYRVIFVPDAQQYYATFYQPIYNPTDHALSGYVGLSLPLIAQLKKKQWHFVDEHSLKFNTTQLQFKLNEAQSLMAYTKKKDFSSITVNTILSNTAQSLIAVSFIITVLLYLLLIYGVRRPLQHLIDYILMLQKQPDLLDSGRFNKKLFVKELNSVASALNTYQDELNKVYGNLDDKNKELLHLAYTDALTGTQNRRAFNDHWQHICSVAESARLDICMMLFDINHFKAINDSYGHQVGDEVLINVARLINSQLREGEHLYRLGGDEFGTVMINCSEEPALEIARRCLQSLESYDFFSLGIKENVRVSVGIACTHSQQQSDLDNLSWQADSAVYLAKRPDNNNIVTFNPDMAESSKSLFSNWMYEAVFSAIETGEGIQIHYQPIIDIASGTICYYESLVRIVHKGEFIPPSHIFPIITARHLDKQMDQAIVKKIHADLSAQRIPAGTGVSINLSGPSTSSPDLQEWLEPLVACLDNYKLMFEVTETVLITQMTKANENLKCLKKLGFIIALDDFGSGYSSVRYLGSMPVDVVKFDMSLIHDLHDPRQRTLIHSLTNMMNEIGYQMVAEGIEDEALLDQVKQAGFDYAQGYYFARPLPVESLIDISIKEPAH